ncbi:MAG: hypothetical protein AVDCRST_MAG88-3689, partial [uncultured Thermomicrobiales bacterium]
MTNRRRGRERGIWEHIWSHPALGLAVPTLFTRGVRSRPFRLALLAATLAHLENVAITLTLAEWRASVPTLWHALHGRPPAEDERPLLAS